MEVFLFVRCFDLGCFGFRIRQALPVWAIALGFRTFGCGSSLDLTYGVCVWWKGLQGLFAGG